MPCPDCKRKTAEVLAACMADVDAALAIYMEDKGRSKDDRSLIGGVCLGIKYRLEQLQPAAPDLEEYVKNLSLSEIARIKGLPGIAKLGKTYDRPDFYATEDE